MPLAVSEAELQALLERFALARNYGIELESIADGECVLRVPFQQWFERPGGIVNGQVLVAAADAAMWFAIMTKLGAAGGSATVTVEMKTNFLSSARKEDLLCHAKILKLGKRLIYGTAECTTLGGKLIAHHTITYIRPDGTSTA